MKQINILHVEPIMVNTKDLFVTLNYIPLKFMLIIQCTVEGKGDYYISYYPHDGDGRDDLEIFANPNIKVPTFISKHIKESLAEYIRIKHDMPFSKYCVKALAESLASECYSYKGCKDPSGGDYSSLVGSEVVYFQNIDDRSKFESDYYKYLCIAQTL